MCTGPRERARECIEAAMSLVERARKTLPERKEMAAEMLWDAVSLAVKAYIYATEGKRIESDNELWALKNRLADKLGEIVYDVFQRAAGLHQCAVEKTCTQEDIEAGTAAVEQLVQKVKETLGY